MITQKTRDRLNNIMALADAHAYAKIMPSTPWEQMPRAQLEKWTPSASASERKQMPRAQLENAVQAVLAENEALRAGYDAARLELASLQARVNECGAGAGCCAQAARIEALEAQLEAVGAGGVGSLMGAPAQPQDGVAFELWRTDHMPDATQEEALAEWRTLHSSQAAQPAAQAQEDAKCEWLLTDDGSEMWDSDCGEAWLFTDGGPAENSVRFCHGCGKQVAIAAQEDTKDAS